MCLSPIPVRPLFPSYFRPFLFAQTTPSSPTGGSQRPVSLRKREEIQAVLWAMTGKGFLQKSDDYCCRVSLVEVLFSGERQICDAVKRLAIGRGNPFPRQGCSPDVTKCNPGNHDSPSFSFPPPPIVAMLLRAQAISACL